MSGPAAMDDVPADRVQQCMADATAALQSVCERRNIALAPDLARDVVLLIAGKELAVWGGVEQTKRLAGELQEAMAETDARMTYAVRSVEFATRAKRYWLTQFCPLCWLWSAVLWCVGVRGPTADDAEELRGG